MEPGQLHHLVVLTGRLSTGLFVMALVGAALGRGAIGLWLAFLAGQTVHFASVAWFANANGGANLFPGGRSLADVGGWPTMLAIFALFYALAAARLFVAHGDHGATLIIADRVGVTAIALFFVAVYAPLLSRSALFALPIAAILGALLFFYLRAAPHVAPP